MPYDYANVTPESVKQETDLALAYAETLLTQAAASAEEPSYDATMRPIDEAWGRAAEAYGKGAFMGQVSTDEAVRNAGTAADERLTKWRVGLAFRPDLYCAVAAFATTDAAQALEGEQKHLLDVWMRDFRRAGQEMDPEVRAELESLRARLVELEVAFQRNVNEARDFIEVTEEQLEGLSSAYIERLPAGSKPGTYQVSLDTPQLVPFMEQSPDRAARHELFAKNWNRAVDVNRPLLEEALTIRQRIAALHGDPSWAHFAMQVKMAGHPERVTAFYDEIVPAVSQAADAEVRAMQDLLAADGQEGPIGAWDWRFYDFRQRRERFGVDSAAVTEYLPLEQVVDGMFALTA